MSGHSAGNVLNTPQSLTDQNAGEQAYGDQNVQSLLSQVASGKTSLDDAINQSGGLTQNQGQLQQQRQNLFDTDVNSEGGAGIDKYNNTVNQLIPGLSSSQLQSAFMNKLATGPSTGGMLAAHDVQNDPLMQQGLNAEQGQLQQGQSLFNNQSGILNNLQSQGYQLQPQDQTLYGQASGNIARQFGQAGNDTANSLAQRGLSNSGAAGASFSGLQGNQNEMLAQAQQQIMQQRFQNTQQQVQQQQQFMNQLNGQNNQMAGQYANTAGNYQNQAFNQNLQGLGAQQQAQNQNVQNNMEQQSQNQNEQNEEFAQKQATGGVGSVLGPMNQIGNSIGSGFGTMNEATSLMGGATKMLGSMGA